MEQFVAVPDQLRLLRTIRFHARDRLILPEDLPRREESPSYTAIHAPDPAPSGVYFLITPPLGSNPGFKKVMRALPWYDFCMRWPIRLSAYGLIALAIGMAVTEGPWWAVVGPLGVAGTIGIGAFLAWMNVRQAMNQDNRETHH